MLPRWWVVGFHLSCELCNEFGPRSRCHIDSLGPVVPGMTGYFRAIKLLLSPELWSCCITPAAGSCAAINHGQLGGGQWNCSAWSMGFHRVETQVLTFLLELSRASLRSWFSLSTYPSLSP